MNSSKDIELAATLAIEVLPKFVRQKLLSDFDFTQSYGISTDSEIKLGEAGPNFSRNSFFAALDEAFAEDSSDVEVVDIAGLRWNIVEFDRRTGGFAVCMGDRSYPVQSHWPLLQQKSLRLANFEAEKKSEIWSDKFAAKWQKLLAEKPLSAHQLFDFFEEREQQSFRVQKRIEDLLTTGRGAWSSFVPSDEDYYVELCGRPLDSKSIAQFATKEFAEHSAALISRDSRRGLRQCLSLCSHQFFADNIQHDSLSVDVIEEVLRDTAEFGDLFAKLGAIEFGVSYLQQSASISGTLCRIIDSILVEDPTDVESRFCSLTAAIFLTGGEISRTKVFHRSKLTFRRYAELAHASVLENLIWRNSREKKNFVSQAISQFSMRFSVQGDVDLLDGPRWIPEFVSPEQLKAEFVGRISAVLHRFGDLAKGTELAKYFGADEISPLSDQMQFPFCYLPGPLEGGAEPLTDLPKEWERQINEALSSRDVEVGSFSLLINTSLVFKPSQTHTELAAKAIADAEYRLVQKDKNSYSVLIEGLAHLAAITRSTDLAAETLVLLKRTLSLGFEKIEAFQVVRILGKLAAANRSQIAWANDLGEMYLWFSLRPLSSEEAGFFLHTLREFMDIKPSLWANLSRAAAGFEIVHQK